MKLFGRLGYPVWPLASLDILPKLFIDRLFGIKKSVTEDHFKNQVERKWNFLMPISGDCWGDDPEICWHAWMVARGLREGPEDLEKPFDAQGVRIRRKLDEVPPSLVQRRVNKEINQQGVHPAALEVIWNYFSDGASEIYPAVVLDKILQLIPPGYLEQRFGLGSDIFYLHFYEKIVESINNFDWDKFNCQQSEVREDINRYNLLIKQNDAWRQERRKISKVVSRKYGQLPKLPESESLLAAQASPND